LFNVIILLVIGEFIEVAFPTKHHPITVMKAKPVKTGDAKPWVYFQTLLNRIARLPNRMRISLAWRKIQVFCTLKSMNDKGKTGESR
jgi:hypothetical protein